MHAELAGLAEKLAGLAAAGATLHQIVQAVPNTLEELARWAQAWGPLTVEVAKWYAVANSSPDYRQAIMQYLYGLMGAGSYPRTLKPPRIDPNLGDGQLLSLIAYEHWEGRGRPGLSAAIYHAQQGLKAEVMAAHMRESDDPVSRGFVEETDRLSRVPPPAARVMTLEEISIH